METSISTGLENRNPEENHYCSGCGNCCRVGGANYAELKRDDDSDVCKFFQEPNVCTIYETRPAICRIDVMAKTHVSAGTVKSIEHHRDISMRICKRVEVIPPDEIENKVFMEIAMEELYKDESK